MPIVANHRSFGLSRNEESEKRFRLEIRSFPFSVFNSSSALRWLLGLVECRWKTVEKRFSNYSAYRCYDLRIRIAETCRYERFSATREKGNAYKIIVLRAIEYWETARVFWTLVFEFRVEGGVLRFRARSTNRVKVIGVYFRVIDRPATGYDFRKSSTKPGSPSRRRESRSAQLILVTFKTNRKAPL